jgi:hypothetical protein
MGHAQIVTVTIVFSGTRMYAGERYRRRKWKFRVTPVGQIFGEAAFLGCGV